MTFWELLDNQICDTCGTVLIEIDDATLYCPKCRDELTLCGSYGTCEGIAHNGPYTYQDGELIRASNLTDGCCDTCGGGWELA
jgi:hypothetical protein